MKHFIIEIRYLLPVEQMTEIVAEHRQFLQGGYERGMLLCSGPTRTAHRRVYHRPR